MCDSGQRYPCNTCWHASFTCSQLQKVDVANGGHLSCIITIYSGSSPRHFVRFVVVYKGVINCLTHSVWYVLNVPNIPLSF